MICENKVCQINCRWGDLFHIMSWLMYQLNSGAAPRLAWTMDRRGNALFINNTCPPNFIVCSNLMPRQIKLLNCTSSAMIIMVPTQMERRCNGWVVLAMARADWEKNIASVSAYNFPTLPNNKLIAIPLPKNRPAHWALLLSYLVGPPWPRISLSIILEARHRNPFFSFWQVWPCTEHFALCEVIPKSRIPWSLIYRQIFFFATR